MPLNQFSEFSPYRASYMVQIADGTSPQILEDTQVFVRRFDQILLTNSDSIVHVVNLALNTASQSPHYASVSVPIGAGTGGTPPVDALTSGMPTGSTGLVLGPSDQITITVEVAVLANNAVRALALGGKLPA